MGSITSGIGLITGVPIQDTVDQLITLAARPRDLLVARTEALQSQQVAVADLLSRVLAVQFAGDQLGFVEPFEQRAVASTNPDLISASITGATGVGAYQFTPVRQATAQQALSGGFASRTAPIGAGDVSFRYGRRLDDGIDLALLGGGTGAVRGKIRITDRSGTSAEVDLRFARTTDDVLRAINDTAAINVVAELRGDAIRLTDLTGQTAANLRVDEVAGGSTAASLGLAGIDVAATVADGQDALSLFDGLPLGLLNDGRGVRTSRTLSDLDVTLADGSSLSIDFAAEPQPGFATATTDAANGIDAQVTLSALATGAGDDNVTIRFVDNPAIVQGNEGVALDESDPDAKTITFQIDAGATTANDIVAAAGGHLELTAIDQGAPQNVRIVYENNDTITQGQESAVLDETDPNDVRLIVQIDAGATTVGDVVAAVQTNPELNTLYSAAPSSGSAADDAITALSNRFAASLPAGGDGDGLIDVADSAITTGGAPPNRSDELTLADLLATINSADPAKLRAEIAVDGDRLTFTDLTSGGGAFTAQSAVGSHAAEDLGLTGAAVAGVITGRRLLGGLGSTLIGGLNGGQGFTLGQLSLTDRNGANDTVDLANVETLDELIDTINAATVSITASVNPSGHGIRLADTSGGGGNLIVATADATTTAESLGVAVDAAVSSVDGDDLRLQTVGENTALSSLGGGAGVGQGTIRITDSEGATSTVDLSGDEIVTLGDVIDAINALGVRVTASVNDEGDGILLADEAGGTQQITVEDVEGTTAADLAIAGVGVDTLVDSQTVSAINGRMTITIELDADDTLDDLAQKINDAGFGVVAGVVNDGSAVTPYRLTLAGQRAGRQGSLLMDTSGLGFSLNQSVRADDALVLFGSPQQANAAVLASSSGNTFTELVPGLRVNVEGATGETVTVSVSEDDTSIVGRVQGFVDAYNDLRAKLDELTAFDETTFATGLLFGSSEALRVDSDLSRFASRRITGAGTIQTLAEVGVRLQSDGALSFDQTAFRDALAEDPKAVREFFTTDTTGVADRFHDLIETLAAEGSSLLVNRSRSLSDRVDTNVERIAFMSARLERRRVEMLDDFVRMESVIAGLQNNLNALAAIQALPPLAFRSN